MADEQRILIQGKLIVGKTKHGALQCCVVPDDDPGAWWFEHFITREELDLFALKHGLVIVER
jgi:hypothetical protein